MTTKDLINQAMYIAIGMFAGYSTCWLLSEPRPGSDYYFGLTVGVMVAYGRGAR